MVFGYFDLTRDVGGRIQPNPLPQERCDRHEGALPYMVLSRFGQARRFRCPFRGCENVGTLVAENVPDPDIADDATTTCPVNNAEAKRRDELETFVVFAVAAKLNVDCARSADPPYPDLECSVNGEQCWFELARIVDSKLAETVSTPWRDNPRSLLVQPKKTLWQRSSGTNLERRTKRLIAP